MQFIPYCPSCGAIRPIGANHASCGRCARAGHVSKIVEDEADRLRRIALWREFYAKHGYTAKEIKAIPFFQRLLNVPLTAIVVDPAAPEGDKQKDLYD